MATIPSNMTEKEYIDSDQDVLDEHLDPEQEKVSEKVMGLLTTIIQAIDTQDRSTRELMLRLWKYLDLLWCGYGNFYWDYASGQFMPVTQSDIKRLSSEMEVDPTLLNKVINLIRPYGESLAGVLTTATPRVKYFPADADNSIDILKSKAYSNIEQKIKNDNQMAIKLIEILIKLWNGGVAVAYNYSHTDEKYGVFEEPVYEDRPYEQESFICKECGNEQLGEETEKVDSTTEELAPDTEKSLQEQLVPSEDQGVFPDLSSRFCKECGAQTQHLASKVDLGNLQVQTGTNPIPKSRQIIEIFGPLNIKIPPMAEKKEDVIYLIKEEEKHIALAKHLYSEHRDKIEVQAGSDLQLDRIMRSTPEISEDTLNQYPTIRELWLRPAAYEILDSIDDVKFLAEHYPTGIKAIFCSDTPLEAEEMEMDEHWTISKNPLYRKLLADPLGKGLIGLHETANDLYQLEVDTVRYSIPETFVNPDSIDLKAREQTRAQPGNMTAMRPVAGGSLSDNIVETKTATIPKEVSNLDAKTEKLLQFISGVLPSVFGGPGVGSKTLGEYQESKNQALQRLSIIWKIVSVFYAEMMAKATRAYEKDLLEDEHFVQEKGTGNYVNVYIRKEDLEGNIGEVKPELTEQFPSTWGQVSGRVMDLLGMNNQVITSWFLHPENVELIYKVIGIDEMYVPGEDQRNKQLYEVSQLIVSEPLSQDPNTGQPLIDPNTGQPIMKSSVPIQPIDDHQIHMAVAIAYMNSPMGIELQTMNPAAYQNVMLHFQEHQAAQMQMDMANAQQAQSQEGQLDEVQ